MNYRVPKKNATPPKNLQVFEDFATIRRSRKGTWHALAKKDGVTHSICHHKIKVLDRDDLGTRLPISGVVAWKKLPSEEIRVIQQQNIAYFVYSPWPSYGESQERIQLSSANEVREFFGKVT